MRSKPVTSLKRKRVKSFVGSLTLKEKRGVSNFDQVLRDPAEKAKSSWIYPQHHDLERKIAAAALCDGCKK